MLETIHEYARERLDITGEGEALARAHAQYFEALALTESEGRGHGGPRREHYRRTYADWVEWLAQERANMETALAWLIDHRDGEAAVRFALSLWRLWLQRNLLAEGQSWMEKIEALDNASRSPEFGWFLGCAAEFPRFRGNWKVARELEDRAIAILRSGDRGRLATCLEALANVVESQGNPDEARSLHEESLTIARELNDDGHISHALNGLAGMAFRRHDYVLMEKLAEEEVALGRKATGGGIPEYLGDLGEARRRLGKLDAAAEAFRESLDLSVKVGDVYLVGESIDGLADVAAARGDFATATTLWAASSRLLAESEQSPWDPEGTDQGKAEATRVLGPERFDELWRTGMALSESDAVARAMHRA
jgi:non-specific serine/threonine protein kinase